MDIKILSSLTSESEKRSDTLIIGTHNGIFHSDEVVACAILCLLHNDVTVQILRSRDDDMLNKCDICVDVGGGDFDHHQPGFNKSRKNGTKYASAGLIFESYGKELITQLLVKYFQNSEYFSKLMYQNVIHSIFKSFDDSAISLVDCEDNGIPVKKHCFSFISSFLPLWFNNNTDDFNNQFQKVLTTTISVLEEELKTVIASIASGNIINSNWLDSTKFSDGILEIPSQTINWLNDVIIINEESTDNQINFVIFPYPNGGWAAQCVPPSIEKKFEQRVSFPSEWAGQTDKLPEISGVEEATFCHNGCFFARANSKDAIVKMCIIATNSIH